MTDNFDFDGKPARPQSRPMQMWDMLSIFVLILTACIGVYFVYIFITPNSPFNILPPGGFGPKTPTATVTPLGLQATWTPSATLELTPSNTPRPTFTPFFTNTPFSLVPPTKTAKPTSTPKAPFTAGTPAQVESTLIHPDLTCNWAGIGGTVAVIGRKDASAAIARVVDAYERETGYRPYVFAGSSSGVGTFR